MNPFKNEVKERILSNAENTQLKKKAYSFLEASTQPQYSYNFSWLDRPIIQYPQDITAVQEVIWKVKPDLIIETGIAHGGSLILSASMLALLDISEAIKTGSNINPNISQRKVLGIDIEIRKHNRLAIEAHPMASRIQMIEKSSILEETIQQVSNIAKNYKKVLVLLDSNHTHDHVLAELNAYAPLTSLNSYCIVFDTVIEDLPDKMFPNRPWGKGNNPKTAVWEYLKTHSNFKIDKNIEDKLLITVASDGYLKRIK